MPIRYGQVGGMSYPCDQPEYVPKHDVNWLPIDTNYNDVVRYNALLEFMDMIKSDEYVRVVDASELFEKDEKTSRQAIWNLVLRTDGRCHFAYKNGKAKFEIYDNSCEFALFVAKTLEQNRQRILAKWRADTDLALFVALIKSDLPLLEKNFTSLAENVEQGVVLGIPNGKLVKLGTE